MKLLIGILIGIVLLPLFAYLYIWFGYAPVATAAPPFPLERKLAKMALHARMEKEAPAQAPIPASEENLLAGAREYREHCAVCHGVRGKAESAIAKGMYPHVPQLFRGKGVTDDPPGETYWIAANGIRLTGMPAFRGSLSDTELWQVSLLLANANKLPPSVEAELAR